MITKARKLRLVAELKSMSDNPDFFADDGEKFSGNKNIIVWTGSESSWLKGMPIAEHYDGYVHPKFAKWLKKNHLAFDWHDAGTIMIYEDI
jgi:hypothetical protein